MKHLIQLLIISIAVIGIASPSFADGDREDRGWDRDKKEQRHHNKKDKKHGGKPLEKIMGQLDEINDKLDELLAMGIDLRSVTQNWDKKLDSTNGDVNGCNSDRFTCIWPTEEHPDGAAVRDNETGLVWDRLPGRTIRSWEGAIIHCAKLEVGGRKGWHLPMKEQLASVVDTSNSLPALPTGHPFLDMPSSAVPHQYWSATTAAFLPSSAWEMDLAEGPLGWIDKVGIGAKAWCVRGGQSYDGQDLNSLN